MDAVSMDRPSGPTVSWRELAWPREHGSWSLALEPIALGLAVAFSWHGLGLGIAAIAIFFARRPLRSWVIDQRADRRLAAGKVVILCGTMAVIGGTAAFREQSESIVWLIPSFVAGIVFLAFDLKKAGREQYAEIAGSIAFAWLPAVIAVLAGRSTSSAVALGGVMMARATPTVLTIRSGLRARKTGDRAGVFPLIASVIVAVLGIVAAAWQLIPWVAAIALIVLAVRSAILLLVAWPKLQASRVGMIEAGLGVAFVASIVAAWPR